MKKILSLVLVTTLLIFLTPNKLLFAGGNEAVIGQWYTSGNGAIVEIYQCGESICGKIIWLAEPNFEDGKPKTDLNNPDENKHQNPIIGLNILEGFERDGDNKWEDGTIYDPENGKSYSCKMTLKGATLEVRGFVGISLFGRTEEWTKVQD